MSLTRDSAFPSDVKRSRGFGSPKATATKVTIGEESVSLKRDGQSDLVMANILGRRTDNDRGCETLWLDRLVHTDGEDFVGWNASGAISTVLIRGLATVTQR